MVECWDERGINHHSQRENQEGYWTDVEEFKALGLCFLNTVGLFACFQNGYKHS